MPLDPGISRYGDMSFYFRYQAGQLRYHNDLIVVNPNSKFLTVSLTCSLFNLPIAQIIKIKTNSGRVWDTMLELSKEAATLESFNKSEIFRSVPRLAAFEGLIWAVW